MKFKFSVHNNFREYGELMLTPALCVAKSGSYFSVSFTFIFWCLNAEIK